MNFLSAIPLELRTVAMFALGIFVGGQANRGIYRLGWRPRLIGPWSPPHENAPPRRWFDRIPVLGWAPLARETPLHGSGFWVRPMLIELFVGAGFAALYWWEMQGGLLPVGIKQGLNLNNVQVLGVLHAQYLSHILLISLMAVATFIDFDEQTIPDTITVPGTLAALSLAVLLPASRLPIATGAGVEGLLVTSPFAWPSWLDGRHALLLGLASFLGWNFAILPKTWTTRRGLKKAAQYLTVSIFRHPEWRRILLLAAFGSLAVAAVWIGGGPRWQSLFTSLAGMAFGGGLVWAVRIIATAALGKEAMGFGDVTLMAMIGAFLGWQPGLSIFFLAPIAALVIAVTQWLLTRRRDIAFGPYLCLAALFLILGWAPLWEDRGQYIFALGWLVPAIVGVCLVLMAGLLWLWRLLLTAILALLAGGDEETGQDPDTPAEEDAAEPTSEDSTR